jgi:hypothetical protein
MPILSASESYREFAQPLYRDASGTNVLVDVDGPGYHDLDGLSATPFEDFVTLTSEVPIVIPVGLGRLSAPEGITEPVRPPIFGAGWITSLEMPVHVDGLRPPFEHISSEVPCPFFREVKSEGYITVIWADSIETKLQDRWHVGDVEARKRYDVIAQNQTKLFPVASAWEDGVPFTGEHQSFLNSFSWAQPLPPNCTGLRLRKTYDRFHGRQRARVLVDGEFVGWWYEPREDRERRWATSEFGIDRRWLEGKSQVRITLDPPAGVALWSMAEVHVWTITPVGR